MVKENKPYDTNCMNEMNYHKYAILLQLNLCNESIDTQNDTTQFPGNVRVLLFLKTDILFHNGGILEIMTLNDLYISLCLMPHFLCSSAKTYTMLNSFSSVSHNFLFIHPFHKVYFLLYLQNKSLTKLFPFFRIVLAKQIPRP